MDRSWLLKKIGAIEGELSAIKRVATGEAIFIPGQGFWTRADFDLILRATGHLPGFRTLLSESAAADGQLVQYGEVQNASGLEDRQLRNELSAASRIARQLLGEKRWPVVVRQDSGSGRMTYSMPAEVVSWYRESTS